MRRTNLTGVHAMLLVLVLVQAGSCDEYQILGAIATVMEGVKTLQGQMTQISTALSSVGGGAVSGRGSSGCMFQLRSWGKFDEKPWHGSVYVDGRLEQDLSFVEGGEGSYRGVGVMTLQRNASTGSCQVTGWRLFDTWASAADGEALAEHLDELAAGTVLAVVTADEVSGRYHDMRNETSPGYHIDPARPIMKKLGADLNELGYRSSFAFVTVKGNKYQTVMDMKASRKGPARVDYFLP